MSDTAKALAELAKLSAKFRQLLNVHEKGATVVTQEDVDLDFERLTARISEVEAIPPLWKEMAHGFSEQHILNGDCPACYKEKRLQELRHELALLARIKDKEG